MDTKLCILLLAVIASAYCDEEVRVVEESTDQEPCVCSDDLTPVCGSDGNTYSNKCHMTCAGKDITVGNEGYCESNPTVVKVPSVQKPCICTRNFKPVCGSDGVTYQNECILKCAGEELTIKNDGPCDAKVKVADLPPTCSCGRSRMPVCGSDGQTYQNECLLKCAGDVTVTSAGPCEAPKEEKPCACVRSFKPVCGSDGTTYANDCVMKCIDENVTILYRGKCEYHVEEEAQRPCTCTRALKPVCSIDNITYHNECLLRCAGKDIKSEGACNPLLRG